MYIRRFINAAIAGAIVFAAAPALALNLGTHMDANATVGSTSVSANIDARITTAKERADREIARRITILNALSTKVSSMARVSANEKSAVASDVQSQIATLTALQAKINSDTDTTTLKTDIQSITKSYRVFALVIPQGRIEVAADRIDAAADLIADFSTKLSARVNAAPAGTDTAAVLADISTINAKIADAHTEASAAVSLIANLKPDNGDQATLQANLTALKNARADIKAAQLDLEAARSDARSVLHDVLSWQVHAEGNASTTVAR